ncbi:hypothetical protein BBOMB_0460 [Bifidobacterium bombi DSM 19703]|uniref:Uncharacterized protein n=1 Tax=Bifidobacterium bombi DSM 19703 TaxID=1341695 RepID=A0A080N2D0_9BIFI|nr:hypothetical protein BBOMB_0460 [Bifidobacterium bombi DSM 19703]
MRMPEKTKIKGLRKGTLAGEVVEFECPQEHFPKRVLFSSEKQSNIRTGDKMKESNRTFSDFSRCPRYHSFWNSLHNN